MNRREHDRILGRSIKHALKGYEYSSWAKVAVDGYNSFAKKKMAPIKRGGSSSGSGHYNKKVLMLDAPGGPFFTPSSRRSSLPMSVYSSRRGSSSTSSQRNTDNGINITVPTIKKNAPKKRPAGKKAVKVSKRFKAGVEAALTPKGVTGTHDAMYHHAVTISTLVDRQHPFDPKVIGLGELTPAQSIPYDFTPEYFVDCMSKLFFGKINGTTTALGTTAMAANDAGNYNLWPQAKLHVVNSSATYKLKNTGEQDMNIHIYLCSPKRASSYNYYLTYTGIDPYVSPDYGSHFTATFVPAVAGTVPASVNWSLITDPGCQAPPLIDWYLQKIKESSIDGYNLSSNANSKSIVQLYSKPTSVSGFRKNWAVSETSIILKPGQEYDYVVPGPRNFDLDFKKLFKGDGSGTNIFQNVQTFMRGPIFTIHTDIRAEENAIGLTGTRSARWLSGLLSIMKKTHCVLKMPDQTGFRVPLGGLVAATQGIIVPLSERGVPRYIMEELPILPAVLTAGSVPQEIAVGGPTHL